VGLDGVTASASSGRCPIVTALTVVCDLGRVELSANDVTTTPTVTITGTVHEGTAPGTLVQNLVNVTSDVPDTNPSNDIVSNAYLISGGPVPVRVSARAASPRLAASPFVNPVPVFAAVLALAGLAAARLVAVRRRRHRVATQEPGPM
jgi:hypothetical protein